MKTRKIAFNINDMNDITVEEPCDAKIMQSTGRKAKGEVIERICPNCMNINKIFLPKA